MQRKPTKNADTARRFRPQRPGIRVADVLPDLVKDGFRPWRPVVARNEPYEPFLLEGKRARLCHIETLTEKRVPRETLLEIVLLPK